MKKILQGISLSIDAAGSCKTNTPPTGNSILLASYSVFNLQKFVVSDQAKPVIKVTGFSLHNSVFIIGLPRKRYKLCHTLRC
jgi:hypothetical protein